MRHLFISIIFLNFLSGQSSTWDIIQDTVWTPKCVMCHDHGLYFAEQSGLILAEDVAYEELINIVPTNIFAAEDGLELVGTDGITSIYSSFLWEKINANDYEHFYEDHPEYGSLMPLGMEFLTNGELEFIRQWIIAGAPETGVVVDESLLEDTTIFEIPEFEPLPLPENGVQFHLGPFEVPPQFERELFYYTEVDTQGILFVNRIETALAAGSHHFIVYTYDDDLPFQLPELNLIRDLRYPDGSYNQYVLYYMAFQKFITGTQTRFFDYRLPEGVALRIDPSYGFDLNIHYANYSNDAIIGEVYNNYHFVDSTDVDHIGKILQLNNNDIVLPPGEETTLNKSFWMFAEFGEIISIFQLWSHAHKHNTEFKVFRRSQSDPYYKELIYLALDWDHPPIIEYDPPMVFHEGDGLELEATFYNDTDEEINFGLLSTDEMMILFGLYYEGENLAADDTDEPIPTQIRISKIYPNPFNPNTTIRFSIDKRLNTSLKIFDISGHLVETLISGDLVVGEHEINWNASEFSSGVYFAKLSQSDNTIVKKLILLK